MNVGSMAYSDAHVYQAVLELRGKHGTEAVITHEMISQHSGVEIRTVRRAIKRLKNQGKLIPEVHHAVGTQFRTADEHSPRPGRT